ncbi:MAG: glycosyltransferase family 4 protein [Armatimonadetes bacterium]|nr:glycosyltransferase family 4 protein [Armatimonadota bacterium]
MGLTVALDARLVGRQMTGDTSYWTGLVSALAKNQGDCRFLLYSNTARPPGIPDRQDFRWIQLPGPDRWWSLVRFPLAARRAGADVFHTQYNLSPLAGSCGVTTVHDVSFLIGPEWFNLRDRLLLQWQIPASCRRAARVITVSETSKKEIERLIPGAAGKVRVTYNALGSNVQPMPAKEALARVKTMGVSQPYLLTVGTRWPRKNMGLALEAARMADRRLVVTGKPGWGDDLAGALLTGYVPDEDLTALYQCADLYLAPSYHEGFGIPLLEAFACECPVLCSQGGALPEVAGGAAELAPSFDAADWASCIERLLADSSKLDAMRRRGADRVKDFSWEQTAAKTLEIYREAANR